MSQQQKPKQPDAKAIYGGMAKVYKKVEALQPLLSLLDEPEPKEGGPIEAIQTLLETVLTSQHQLHLSLEDLHNKVDALSKRRPSAS